MRLLGIGVLCLGLSATCSVLGEEMDYCQEFAVAVSYAVGAHHRGVPLEEWLKNPYQVSSPKMQLQLEDAFVRAYQAELETTDEEVQRAIDRRAMTAWIGCIALDLERCERVHCYDNLPGVRPKP